MATECTGTHRFFVPEVVGIENEGKIYVVAICTSCGETFAKEFKVGGSNTVLTFAKEQKRKESL